MPPTDRAVSRGSRLKDRGIDYLTSMVEPDLNSGCWLWSGAVTTKGYGLFSQGRSRLTYAHRAMFEATKGALPGGKLVMHSCDTPSCCNPSHLSAGTVKDNSEDMVRKGRSLRGERQTQARLTEADVLAIRADPRAQRTIATAYGVGVMTINHVKHRRTWRHVA